MENNRSIETSSSIRYYFVDEGGDAILFSRNGKELVGTEGCSRFFIVGLLAVQDPETLQKHVNGLRDQLIGDPYFHGVPSMRRDARKTAVEFHAKDDLPEVRREVFRLLRKTENLRFYAVVTDKRTVLEYVRQRQQREPCYRYRPSELYNHLTQHLIKKRLSGPRRADVIFSRRDKFDRSDFFRELVETASTPSEPTIQISSAAPQEYAGLQAVDYFVWALQRLYERGEERYLAYLWDSFRQVDDIDDTRTGRYGASYTQSNPLTAEGLAWRKQE